MIAVVGKHHAYISGCIIQKAHCSDVLTDVPSKISPHRYTVIADLLASSQATMYWSALVVT